MKKILITIILLLSYKLAFAHGGIICSPKEGQKTEKQPKE
jgi:hypothetical protein